MANKNAYIVTGYRTAVGKANRGKLRFVRPDDMAAAVIRKIMKDVPNLDPERIDDVIVGNANPEAEQGLNIGRLISLMSLDTEKVPGVTVNRYCSSGLETIAIATAKINMGIADCIIAGGTESMSAMPMGGWKIVPNPDIAKKVPSWYWGMGLTAEEVAKDYNVSREDQDKFALHSHEKALKAIDSGRFNDEICPIEVERVFLDANEKRQVEKYTFNVDEGPRRGTTLEAMAKLKPVFMNGGTVTAGNSSQTSDGAAFVLVMSERMVKELNLQPVARLVDYTVAAVPPRVMGIGPAFAVPKLLKQSGFNWNQIDLVELNEAFASQSVAVIREWGIDPSIVNVNGGAIALGHPLGCTGAKLTVQMFNELKKQNKRYGIVTMCVGSGQGAAGIIERL